MTRRRALGAFPDRGALASSDGASAVTPVGSKVIGLSTLGVALLATAYVWASTVLMLFNAAAVLALIFWIGVTVWRQVGRDPRLHTALGDKVGALAIGALHWPMLVAVLILGLVIVGAVAPSYLISVALIGVSATIGLRRLTVIFRGTALGRLYRAHGRRVTGANCKVPDPIARAKPQRVRPPKPIDECNKDQEAEESAELRISFTISPQADRNEAARLAIRAVTAMKQTRATQPPTCLQLQTADGGAILDIRFQVCDVRRGREHVLDEIESRLWDLLHESGIPFAIPGHAISATPPSREHN